MRGNIYEEQVNGRSYVYNQEDIGGKMVGKYTLLCYAINYDIIVITIKRNGILHFLINRIIRVCLKE